MSQEQPTIILPKTAQMKKPFPCPSGASKKFYVVRLDGDCMAPHLLHHAYIGVEPTIPAFNELAVFYFADGSRPMLKQCRTEIDRWVFPVHPQSEVGSPVRFRQWNPLKNYLIYADKLEAIHTVKWVWTRGKWRDIAKVLNGSGMLDTPSPGVATKAAFAILDEARHFAAV